MGGTYSTQRGNKKYVDLYTAGKETELRSQEHKSGCCAPFPSQMTVLPVDIRGVGWGATKFRNENGV